MATSQPWVLLTECYNMAELHTLRSTLQAHGVPHRVDGEHAHNIFGPIHGAVARSRIMVPPPALPLARELAEHIVGPFEQRPVEPDDEPDASPFRRMAELPPDEEPDEPPATRPKSYVVLALVGLMGGSWFGLGHLYTGRGIRAGVLSMISIFSLAAWTRGEVWPAFSLIGVWIYDVIGGAKGIAEHNARVEALAAAQDEEADGSDDEDEDDDGEEEEDGDEEDDDSEEQDEEDEDG